jgi:hypothetical protein
MLHKELVGPALRDELWFVEAEPDLPGPESDRLWNLFQQYFIRREGVYAGWTDLKAAKEDIQLAIMAMGGMWNEWHKHAYGD